MKICFVTPSYPPNVHGGGEISVQLLAEEVASRDDIDDVLVISFDGECEERVNGVRVKRLGTHSTFPLELPNIFVAIKLLRHRELLAEFDILHGYNVYYHPALGVVSRLLSIPSVATLNSYALLPKSAYGVRATGPRKVYDRLFMPTTGRILRILAQNINQFICLSAESESVYVENGFDGNNIATIPNMVDPSFEISTESEDNETIRILYVGSLIKRKGVQYLVQSAAYLPKNFEIRIVGDGPQKIQLIQKINELSVTDQVSIIGRIPYSDIESEYAKADIFVHPGIWPEPFGRTLLEAMQASLPVVATNIGGPSDIVPSEEFLCPPKDAKQLAKAIRFAASKIDMIGSQNRTMVMEQYSPERITEQIMELYAETIGE
ncbi:glycosyltransferase family 4 protein [Halomicroarcula limicola]|uniref:Glycosyltransferase family 4 protein n=1 Tax=Haloarcula limicola TaxID=1429915 RepID=A0A8J8C464_9EURY|nr:glycosyltransferase family 4 protein [Halomicroarcula limicola]MBV0925226.1 glycosyltransferase family 4 protein [Halomicroarcula limicola]